MFKHIHLVVVFCCCCLFVGFFFVFCFFCPYLPWAFSSSPIGDGRGYLESTQRLFFGGVGEVRGCLFFVCLFVPLFVCFISYFSSSFIPYYLTCGPMQLCLFVRPCGYTPSFCLAWQHTSRSFSTQLSHTYHCSQIHGLKDEKL